MRCFQTPHTLRPGIFLFFFMEQPRRAYTVLSDMPQNLKKIPKPEFPVPVCPFAG
jgi:hypothetical protein